VPRATPASGVLHDSVSFFSLQCIMIQQEQFVLEMLMTHCCSDRSISDGLAATGMLDVRVQVGMWHVGRTSIRHYL
jgi:hypothetical protein